MYKDKHGKDEHYKVARDKAWKNAEDIIKGIAALEIEVKNLKGKE